MAAALAQVDVNKADAAALDSIRGLGPAKTKAILDERKKGEFKDWADLEQRVKGIGEECGQAVGGRAGGQRQVDGRRTGHGHAGRQNQQSQQGGQVGISRIGRQMRRRPALRQPDPCPQRKAAGFCLRIVSERKFVSAA
jgi:hypothetical protein